MRGVGGKPSDQLVNGRPPKPYKTSWSPSGGRGDRPREGTATADQLVNEPRGTVGGRTGGVTRPDRPKSSDQLVTGTLYPPPEVGE